MSSASVILPVLGPAPQLDRLLRALEELPSTTLREVIVVDNTDPESSEVRAAVERAASGSSRTIRLIHEPKGYSYAARNAGIAAAVTEYLAFMNVDVVRESGYGHALGRLVGSGRIARFTGPVNQFVERIAPLPWDRCAQAFDLIFGLHQKTYAAGEWAATANLVVHRATVEEVGPFDDSLETVRA